MSPQTPSPSSSPPPRGRGERKGVLASLSLSPVPGERARVRGVIHRPTNGLFAFSCPIVVLSPWPGMTIVSSSRVKSRSRIERRIFSESPPHRSVRPIPSWKSVSPEKRTFPRTGTVRHTLPGVWPGVWITSASCRPNWTLPPSARNPSISGGRGGGRPNDLDCAGRFSQRGRSSRWRKTFAPAASCISLAAPT